MRYSRGSGQSWRIAQTVNAGGAALRRSADASADSRRVPLAAPPAGAVASAVASDPANAHFCRAADWGRPSAGWSHGPVDPAGLRMDASDSNLLCLDVLGNTAVVGSADHALTVWDTVKGRKTRTLYNKKFGHSEWVTTCAFLRDGRVLSGGMDSKLCLWHKSIVKCDDLLGHTGSVSQVMTNSSDFAVSAGYDRTLRVWNCAGASGHEVATLAGHTEPVMHFEWADNTLVSGDRKGKLILWDVTRATGVAKLATQGGQIGAVGSLFQGDLQVATAGDQAGFVSIWDFRNRGATPVFASKLHPGGVVSGLKSVGSPELIVTAGADRRILCLEPRRNFEPVMEFTDHRDFIYSLETHGHYILSGNGQGHLLVHDTMQGKCLYGIGANAAAVRGIKASANSLVAAGDDGKLLSYQFP